jgi:hypothetical protein
MKARVIGVLAQISTRLRITGDFPVRAVPSRHGDASLRHSFDLLSAIVSIFAFRFPAVPRRNARKRPPLR